MRATRLSLVSSLCLTVPLIIAEPAMAQADAPYGTATFRAYPDIAQVRQLKVLWDFNFSDPEAVRLVLNYVGALIQATMEFGPHEIDPIQIVVVSHGPEAVVFARQNYEKYKDIVDRAANFAKQGVRFQVCGRPRPPRDLSLPIYTGLSRRSRPDPTLSPIGRRKASRSTRSARLCPPRPSTNSTEPISNERAKRGVAVS